MIAALGADAQDDQQDQPQGEFGEELAVTEVLLDVLVTDANGDVVIGLGADDFVVKTRARSSS